MFKHKCKNNNRNSHIYINDGYSNKKGTTYKIKLILYMQLIHIFYLTFSIFFK